MPEDVKMSLRLAASALHRLINGFQVSQAIHVAAVLGVADCMDATPRASDEITAAVVAISTTLRMLLGLL